MKLSHLLYIIIFLFAANACERNVYFEVETQENKLVLSSVVQPDSTVYARLTLSADPLKNSFEFTVVEDAVVSLYKNQLQLRDIAIVQEKIFYWQKMAFYCLKLLI